MAQDCQLLLQEEAGFAGVLDLIAGTLSPELRILYHLERVYGIDGARRRRYRRSTDLC